MDGTKDWPSCIPTGGEGSTTVVDGGSVTWSVADISVQEGDPAIFTVTLSDLVQDDVTLTYSTQKAVEDTATSRRATTLHVLNGSVTVNGNSRSANFTVATHGGPRSGVDRDLYGAAGR